MSLTEFDTDLPTLDFSHVMIDLTCPNGYKMMERLSKTSRSFVAFGKNDSLQHLSLDFTAKVLLISPSTGGFQIYHTSGHEPKLVGSFRGHDLHLKEIKAPLNLEGNVASSCICIPKTPDEAVLKKYLEGTDGGHRDSVHRMGYQLITIIAELYNFKVHWIRAGNKPEAAKMSGCLAVLARGDADFSASAMTILSEYLNFIDSGLSVFKHRQFFVFRHPKQGRGMYDSRNEFLLPFSNAVWVTFLAISILTYAVFYAVQKYEFIQHAKESNRSTGSTALVMLLGSLSQQGVSERFYSFHSRIIIMVALLMSFFVLQFYSASIVGTLLTPPLKSIRDEKRLMQSNLRLVLENVPSSVQTFKVASSSVTSEFYNKKIWHKEVFLDLQEGVQLVKAGGFAFFTLVDHAYDLIRRLFTYDEIDELQEISVFPNSELYFPVKKFSPYKEVIRVGMQRLQDLGIVAYWRKRWESEKPIGNLAGVLKFTQVDLEHFSTILYLLALGFLISFGIFAWEIIESRYKRENKWKKVLRRHSLIT